MPKQKSKIYNPAKTYVGDSMIYVNEILAFHLYETLHYPRVPLESAYDSVCK